MTSIRKKVSDDDDDEYPHRDQWRRRWRVFARRLGQERTFASMYERWKCLQYVQNVQGTLATRGHGGWSAFITNPLEGNTVEIACLEVIARHRLNTSGIVPNDGNVHNDTVRIPWVCTQRHHLRNVMNRAIANSISTYRSRHVTLHFQSLWLKLCPISKYISTLTRKQGSRSRSQTSELWWFSRSVTTMMTSVRKEDRSGTEVCFVVWKMKDESVLRYVRNVRSTLATRGCWSASILTHWKKIRLRSLVWMSSWETAG